MLDGVEIDIDFWPLIPTYVEFEADSVKDIENLCTKLDIKFESLTTMSIPEIYAHYGKSVRAFTHVYLEEERKNLKF